MAQEEQQQATTQTAPPPQPGQNGDGQASPRANGNGNGQPQAQNGNGAATPPNGDAEPKKPGITSSPLFKIAVVIVLIIAVIWGIKYWNYSQNHVTTDDAYVTGDLINVSPIISGTLSKLNVDEGDVVKAGQVIAVLDQSGPRAAYQQALAAYQAAQSQIPQAETTYEYEKANTAAGIGQAQAAFNAQVAKTAQSQRQMGLIAATTSTQVQQDQAQAAATLAQGQTAYAQYLGAQQAVQTSRNAASAARQQVNVAQANYVRAQRDANRYAALYGPNGSVAAVTAQQLDQAVATADSDQAQLQATRDQADQAQSQVQQEVAAAQAALQTYKAALKQYGAALAQTRIAQANEQQVPVQKFGVANNAAIARQNFAQLQAAQANEKQVTLRKQQVLTASAEAAQAKAAMQNANVTLGDTIIYAPTNGTVVRKGANVGDALTPGQTIVTMTQTNYVWIEANYKETQLEDVRPGQPVEVDVDTFPGKIFHGTVQSVNAASGNTVSLLPADNATGNFTKVVQRIPVKILLTVPKNPGPSDATAQDIANLRQGMSVETDIDISSARNKKSNQ